MNQVYMSNLKVELFTLISAINWSTSTLNPFHCKEDSVQHIPILKKKIMLTICLLYFHLFSQLNLMLKFNLLNDKSCSTIGRCSQWQSTTIIKVQYRGISIKFGCLNNCVNSWRDIARNCCGRCDWIFFKLVLIIFGLRTVIQKYLVGKAFRLYVWQIKSQELVQP